MTRPAEIHLVPSSTMRTEWRLSRITFGVAVTTLVLMTMGSLVHGTGSSLACPDWPLCNGNVFPKMVGGVEFEHTHRLIALAVVTMTVVLLGLLWRGEKRLRRLAAAACGLLVVQAGLGALTVIYKLPAAISIAHLATSMAFLSLVIVLGVRLAPIAVPPSFGAVRTWVGVTFGIVFGQIVIGAAVRHTGAALACPSMPLCGAPILPWGALQWLQMSHRTIGAVAFCAAIATSVMARRAAGEHRHMRWVVTLPAVLAVTQVALGVALLLTYLPLDLVTLHHTCGALLLGSLALVWALASVVKDEPS